MRPSAALFSIHSAISCFAFISLPLRRAHHHFPSPKPSLLWPILKSHFFFTNDRSHSTISHIIAPRASSRERKPPCPLVAKAPILSYCAVTMQNPESNPVNQASHPAKKRCEDCAGIQSIECGSCVDDESSCSQCDKCSGLKVVPCSKCSRGSFRNLFELLREKQADLASC